MSRLCGDESGIIDHVEALPPAKFLSKTSPDFAMFDQDGNVFRISQL